MSSDVAQTVSQLLQAGWTLTSPTKTDIYWGVTRPETVDFLALGKQIVVNCYNPMGDVVVAEPLSREVWKRVESVVVDVIVKAGDMATAVSTRESIRNEVYRVIHMSDPSFWVEKETYKVESPEIVRLTLIVKYISFTVKGTS